MLRNLNRSYTRGRICGTPHTGVLGSLIPSSGTNGPGYAYNDLVLPADADKEICGRITTWPAAGTLFAYEDTSLSFTGAPDGSYTFQYQLYVGGVTTGAPATVTLTVGSGATTINGIIGNANAAGLAAALNLTIGAAVGNAGAEGQAATITMGADTVISCSTANSIAAGLQAGVNRTISTLVGNAPAGVVGASIIFGGNAVIMCSVGNAVAAGAAAMVTSGIPMARAPSGTGFHSRIIPGQKRPAAQQDTIR